MASEGTVPTLDEVMCRQLFNSGDMWPCVDDGGHDVNMPLFRVSLRDMRRILNVDIAPHASKFVHRLLFPFSPVK